MNRLLLMLALIGSATSAHAQYCVEAVEEGRVPVRGTVAYAAGFGAFERVAQTYGAASMLEKRLLPFLRFETTDYAFMFDYTSMLGAMTIPVCGESRNDPLGRGQLDLGTGGIGIGKKVGPVTLFYAGNATYRAVREESAYSRWGISFGLPLMASFITPIAPAYRRYEGEAMTVSLDFIAGAEVGNSLLSGSAGYVASKGFYGNLTSPLFGFFGSAVLGTDFGSLPVATLGVTDLDWLVGDLRDTIGSTSVYSRRLEYNAAPQGSLSKKALATAKTGSFGFTTVHVEQWGIGGVLDLESAMTVRPKLEFYQAAATYHSDGLLPDQQNLSRAGSSAGLFASGYRVTAGLVKLPVLFSHGSKGGYVPRAGIEVGLFGGGSDSSQVIVSSSLQLNPTDIVSVFPYARNVVSFTFKVGAAPM